MVTDSGCDCWLLTKASADFCMLMLISSEHTSLLLTEGTELC